MNDIETLDKWKKTFMNHPAGTWLGWINNIYWLGCGVGYPVASWIANRYGRKPGVYVGYIFLILGSVLQAAAPNGEAFLQARLFLGFASALFGNAVLLLLTIWAEKEASSNGPYAEMVKTPGNHRRLIISISPGIFAQWAGNGVITYYLPLILTSVGATEVRDQTLISACLQMLDRAFAALGAFLMGWDAAHFPWLRL